MLSRLSIAALWSPAGKGLTSWFLFEMLIEFLSLFSCGILGQVWYLIVSIPDLCSLSYSSDLSILIHGTISLPDMMSYDKYSLMHLFFLPVGSLILYPWGLNS